MNNPLLRKVEEIHQILENQATGGNVDNDKYIALRQQLLSNHSIKQYLPQIINDCRKPLDFWDYIKTEFDSYAERRQYLRKEFSGLYDFLESKSNSCLEELFKRQFPLGMPFGLHKPSLAAIPDKGTQKIHFEETKEIGLIKDNVYPNFTYSILQKCLINTPIYNLNLQQTLTNICQTEWEKKLFNFYLENHVMWNENVPILIPQAWIQWHSNTKNELRSNNSSYADDLYRVDFVAFWNNKRYAILVDDISHYAKKNYSYWNANEEKYSMRLKEDRKLRKEGWEVFRISNWEIRNEQYISEIIDDLLDYFESDMSVDSSQEEQINNNFSDIPF